MKHSIYLKEIKKIANRPAVDTGMVKEVIDFIKSNEHLTRPENPTIHLGAFCVPFHVPSKKVLLGNHIKADDWIPPGGHIEAGEHPTTTVKREFEEELQYKITDEKIELFNICTKLPHNPKYLCQKHYDFWYLVPLQTMPEFIYDPKEFTGIQWAGVDDLPRLIKRNPDYLNILTNLLKNV